MKNQIDNLLHFTLLNIESSQRIKKDNLPLLECYIKKTSSSTYTIIDTIKKNCIKCYFNAQSQIQMNILSELDRKNIMKISIAKYSFDYLFAPKNNEIFSSIVIVIDTFSLSEEERKAALVLSRAIRLGEQMAKDGEKDAAKIEAAMTAEINAEPLAKIDYVSIVDAVSIEPVENLQGEILGAIAVYIGKTRLIDNFMRDCGA